MAKKQTGIGAIGTPAGKKAKGTKEAAMVNGIPQIRYGKDLGGDIGIERIGAPQINVDPMQFTDTKFTYADVQAGRVSADQLANQLMTAADYTMVDPREIAGEYGDIAREQIGKNVDLSTDQASKFLAAELAGLQSFTPAAANLKRGEISADNAFNQAQRDAALESGDPSLRRDLEGQAERARAYAEGRVPDSIQDRALELGVRSRAADSAALGGFGARSSAARKASELMSAERRIELSQYGDQALTQNIANRSNLLLAPTQYSNAGASIDVMSKVSGAQAALQLTGQANDKSIISSETALQNQTQQEQFKTGIEQDTNKFNTGLAAERDANQAQLNLQAGTTNAQMGMQAQEINSRNAISTQQFGMQLGSQERQFNNQLAFNQANANADRTFNAANANAGRQLEAAVSNRNARLQVQTTNKQMVFQDIQQQKQINASMAQAAMSARASMSNAALSASVQRESIAANLALQREAQQFQLGQQDKATQLYIEERDYARRANELKQGAQMIQQAPAIIKGVSTIAGAVSSVYDGFSNTPATTPTTISGYDSNAIGQNADGTLIYAY